MRDDRRLPRYLFVLILIVIVVIAAMLYQRQRSDIETLQRTLQSSRTRELILQNEVSEKQREVNISESNDYIASHARENGYMMPGEIRFIVSNPEALLDGDTVGSAVVTPVDETQVDETPNDAAPDVTQESAADGSVQDPTPQEEVMP